MSPRQVYTRDSKNKKLTGKRNKSTDCSPTGPGFESQHAHLQVKKDPSFLGRWVGLVETNTARGGVLASLSSMPALQQQGGEASGVLSSTSCASITCVLKGLDWVLPGSCSLLKELS